MIKIGATLFATAFLFLGCTATTPDHQPQHNHEASKDRYNDRVLNCAHPDGHHVYEVQQQCPLDGEPFTALSLGTYSTMGRHLDWEPISYMRFPVALPICPSSGFVVQQSDYTTAEVAQLKTAYTSKTYQDLYSQVHASYFLYARALELAEMKQDQHWWLYLNATWEVDNCGDRVKYHSYALSTIQEAQSSLQSAQISPMKEWS